MSGMNFNLLPPTLFNFGGNTGIIGGGAITLNLAQRIDLTSYESGTLVVRVHSISFSQAGDAISVDLLNHGYTPDDPGTDFGNTGLSILTGANPIAVSNGTVPTPPAYLTSALISPFTGLARLTVKGAVQTTNNSCNAKISVDLVLKTGGGAAPMVARTPGCFQGYR